MPDLNTWEPVPISITFVMDPPAATWSVETPLGVTWANVMLSSHLLVT